MREAERQAQLETQMEAQLVSQKILADSFINNAKVVSDSIDNGFEKSMTQLLQIYQHDHQAEKAEKAESENLKQNQEMQKQLMVQLVGAVEQLAQKMAQCLSSRADDQASTTGVTEQTTLMANALKQALAPLTMRMDEKLAIDSSTDQSGKLIVNSLNRLNKIFNDYE